MPSILVLEDGTGLNNANTYCDVAFADTYHTLYSNTDWSGSTAIKETALVNACQSLDLLYADKFQSMKLELHTSSTTRQALNFPRYSFYDQNANLRLQGEIPVELQRAQAEIALFYLAGDAMIPELNADAFIGQQTVKVGAIEQATTYKKPQQVASYAGWKKIDVLLWSILKPKNVMRLSL